MNKFFKKIAVVLAIAMVFAAMPMSVFAADVSDETVLRDAVAAGGEIVLGGDIELTQGIVIEAGTEIVLDLAGHKLSYTSLSGNEDQLIKNSGKLIIKDSGQNGLITFKATNAEGTATPGYASNTITNMGELIIESGTVQNTTTGTAAYVVDNNSTAANVSLTVNGGKVEHTQSGYSGAIRLFAGSTTNTNITNIKGGKVEGRRAVWIQLPGEYQRAEKAELNITNGTIDSTDEANRNLAIYVFSYGDSFSGTKINISGGVIDGNIELKDSIATNENIANIPAGDQFAEFNISGGEFRGSINNATASNNGAGVNVGKPIAGGTFTTAPSEEYIADGKAYDPATGIVGDPTTSTPDSTTPESTTHEHVWGYNTQFDAAAHWDYCHVCGAKNTPVAHSDANGDGYCVCGWPMTSAPSRVNPNTGVTAEMLK